MTRFFVLSFIAVTVIAVGGLVTWQIVGTGKISSPVTIPSPTPKKFDTTGGQIMRPRWNRDDREGEADAVPDN